MEQELAYCLCRKRAYSRWRGPDRYASPEDIAHDAWLVWLANQHVHPYQITDTVIINWYQRNYQKKRSIGKRSDLADDIGRDDDPSGPAIVNELLATTLQLLMSTSRKQSVMHVATLLMSGYTPAEIMVENDYELMFISNVRQKVRSCMPEAIRSQSMRNHRHGDRTEYVRRNRARLNARRRKYQTCKT